jgi:GH3 auxin-responsive promoter
VIRWTAILEAAANARKEFSSACGDAPTTQKSLLLKIISENAGSQFGRLHDFGSIDSVAAFRSRVPIRGYEQFLPWTDRAVAGSKGVLTSENPIGFEETGGSTSGRKLIPCTIAGLRSFRDGILPWLGDLSEIRPAAFDGLLYAAMSPVAWPKRATANGVPIGPLGDAAYLGADLAPSLADVVAVPSSVGELSNVDKWRFSTLLHLLNAPDLTFISIFSPTFLLSLIEQLPALAESLLAALHEGISAPPNPERARVVARALGRRTFAAHEIWPWLDTISAWADGTSAIYADRLHQLFPDAYFQPKGLMATEGVVSIPWATQLGSVPALRSAFLEFLDDDGDCHLSHELREGSEYVVLITTPSGLYRYALGDRVVCRSIRNNLPRLAFVCREGAGSDLVGEKLSEKFVASVLREIGQPACLVARPAPPPFYELLVEASSNSTAQSLAHAVDAGLQANPQYAYARAMGQIGTVQGRMVKDLVSQFHDACLAGGMRAGDIKPPILVTDPAKAAALGAKALFRDVVFTGADVSDSLEFSI